MGAAPADGSPKPPLRRAYRFEGFRLEVDTGLLYEDDREVALPPRALAVLVCFLEHPGEVLSKDELLERGWPESFVSEDSLTHAISLIRQALDDDPRQPRFVQTLPRRGYRFVAEVEGAMASDLSEPPAVSDRSPAASTSHFPSGDSAATRLAPRRATWVAAAVFVAASLLLWGRFGGPVTGDGDAGSTDRPIQISRLGLRDLSPTGVPLAAEVAEALAPELIDLIERETKLTVVPLGNAQAADQERAVDAILSADIVVDADRIRIAARVREASTGDNWWRHEWDIPEDLFRPDAFARSLLTRLGFLLDHASVYSTLRPSTSKEATLLVVQAAELLLGPAQRDLGIALQAAELLRRASVLDADFARARAGRVAARAEAVGWRPWTPAELAEAEGEIAVARRSDPNDPVVHIATALHALLEPDVEASQAAIDRAGALAPEVFWVSLIAADVELRLGQPAVALATTRRGLELDPYQLAMHGRLVDVYRALDDLDAAEQAAAKLASLDPGGFWSGRAEGRILWARGLIEEAEMRFVALRDRWAGAAWIHHLLAEFYAETGRPELAARENATLEALAR